MSGLLGSRTVLVFAHGTRWLYALTINSGLGVLEATTEKDALAECRCSFPGWTIKRMECFDVPAEVRDPWPTSAEIVMARRSK